MRSVFPGETAFSREDRHVTGECASVPAPGVSCSIRGITTIEDHICPMSLALTVPRISWKTNSLLRIPLMQGKKLPGTTFRELWI